MRVFKGIIVFSICFVVASCQDILGPMNVIRDKLTLSGFSSGGTMAQMLQFSYSSMFYGIAVFSHTFYRCGPPNGIVNDYDRFCTTLFNFTDAQMYNPDLVHRDIKEYFEKGLIENPNNLRNKRLYVYSGLRNVLFTPRKSNGQSFNILRVYEPYIQNLESIKTRVQDATQVLPTNNYGSPCTQQANNTEFIGNCGFSGVTEAINFLLCDNYDHSEAFRQYNTIRGNLLTFDQTEFTNGLQNHNMDTVGYYYVPQLCKSGKIQCYLHFYFHGCFTGREFNGPRHIENSGLIELAERKNIIMIFPQAVRAPPENRIGCWDTFGVAGKYYATQVGPQVTALKRMLDKILNVSLFSKPGGHVKAASQIQTSYAIPSNISLNVMPILQNLIKLEYMPPARSSHFQRDVSLFPYNLALSR